MRPDNNVPPELPSWKPDYPKNGWINSAKMSAHMKSMLEKEQFFECEKTFGDFLIQGLLWVLIASGALLILFGLVMFGRFVYETWGMEGVKVIGAVMLWLGGIPLIYAVVRWRHQKKELRKKKFMEAL